MKCLSKASSTPVSRPRTAAAPLRVVRTLTTTTLPSSPTARPPPPEMQHPHSRAGSHAHQQAATHSGGRQRRSSRPQLVSHFGGPRWCLFVTGGRANERPRKAAAGTAAEKCSSWNATHATAPSCPKATRSSRPHLHYALYPRLRPLSPSGYRPSARLQHRVLVSVRA